MSHDDPQHIAIIGAAGRFPHAEDLKAFWANLAAGRNCATRFSDTDLAQAGVPAEVRQKSNYVPVRAVLTGADEFDAGLFGFSPAEAKLTDPQQRVFLEVAWTALEAAGYDPTAYDGPIGVYAGADQSHLATTLMLARAHDPITLMGNSRDYLATRVAFELDLRGPAVTIQTACSTSLVAVQMACQSLLGFQCDIALAGGVGINFPQRAGYLYEEGGVLSPDGMTRTFDRNARGTFGGDGCGVVVLRRLRDALAAGDTIRAVIEGAAINNDGAHKIGFSAPSVEGQAEVIAMAHALAGIEPDEVGYVEAHGTGTPLGDTVEMSALDDVFKAGTARRKFCAIGSLKTNLGHLNSASGIAGLLKAMLALEHRALPPSLNFETPNPEIAWDDSCFVVNTAYRSWPDAPAPRRAGVSSFGVGGTNAHLILREAPMLPPPADRRSATLLVVSAHGEAALERITGDLAAALETGGRDGLDDAAHTLLVGRRPLEHRRMVVVTDPNAAATALRSAPAVVVATTPTVLFRCSTVAAPGPTPALFAEEPRLLAGITDELSQLSAALALRVNARLTNVGTASSDGVTPIAEFLRNLAIDRFWRSLAVTPDGLVACHRSALTAACLAGVLTSSDALALLVESGRDDRRGATRERAIAKIARRIVARPPRLPIHEATTGAAVPDKDVMTPDYWLRSLLEAHSGATTDATLPPSFHILELRASTWAEVLHETGRLFLAGVAFDRTALLRDHGCRRVPLPTYSFEHQVYLPEVIAPVAPSSERGVAPPATTQKLPPGRWLYLPTWIRQTPIEPEPIGGSTWLVFSDRSEPGRGIRERLLAAGASVVTITSGATFQATADGFGLNPLDPRQWEQLLDQALVQRSDGPTTRAMFLWKTQALVSLRGLAGAWARSDQERSLELAIITSGTASVTGDETIEPTRAALHAAALLPEECEGLTVKLIDVDQGFAPDVMAAAVIRECGGEFHDRVVALRGGARFVSTFLPIEASSRATGTALREHGVYLVIGGLGQLGLALSHGLASRFAARLVLTSRQALPPRAAWPDIVKTRPAHDRLALRLSTIAAIESAGGEVDTVVADTTKPESVVAAIAHTRERFGAIHGLIHAAGGAGADALALIRDGDPAAGQSATDRRLDSALTVIDAAPADLDFVLLNSSLATAVGGIGLFDYAASHFPLDALAIARPDKRPRVVAIDWDAWRPPLLAEADAGISGAIGPQEGAQVLAWALAKPHLARVAVSTSDITRRLPRGRERGKRATIATKPHPRPASSTPFVGPRTPLEAEVAAIWQRLFSIAPLGVDDNFFDLGGDSLMAIQLRNDMRESLAADLTVEELFQEPTIAAVAKLVESGRERMRADHSAIDGTLSMVEQMTDDEVKRMLAKLGAGKVEP